MTCARKQLGGVEAVHRLEKEESFLVAADLEQVRPGLCEESEDAAHFEMLIAEDLGVVKEAVRVWSANGSKQLCLLHPDLAEVLNRGGPREGRAAPAFQLLLEVMSRAGGLLHLSPVKEEVVVRACDVDA